MGEAYGNQHFIHYFLLLLRSVNWQESLGTLTFTLGVVREPQRNWNYVLRIFWREWEYAVRQALFANCSSPPPPIHCLFWGTGPARQKYVRMNKMLKSGYSTFDAGTSNESGKIRSKEKNIKLLPAPKKILILLTIRKKEICIIAKIYVHPHWILFYSLLISFRC